MRWDNLLLAGLGMYLPEQEVTTDRAVSDRLYDAKVCAANGYRAVRVSQPHETGPAPARKHPGRHRVSALQFLENASATKVAARSRPLSS